MSPSLCLLFIYLLQPRGADDLRRLLPRFLGIDLSIIIRYLSFLQILSLFVICDLRCIYAPQSLSR
jgi:hypothetical protein